MLDLLITLGPVFSINRLIGKARTVRFERWLLDQGREVLMSWRQVGFLAVRIIPLLLLQFVLSVPGNIEGLVRFANPELSERLTEAMYGDPTVGLATSAVCLFLAIKTAQFMARRVHSHVNRLAADWRVRFRQEPPAEYLVLEGPFRFWRSWWWASWLPFHAAKRFLLIPIVLAAATIAFAPIWGAEAVRARLNPAGDSYIDIIAYAISVGAMVRRLAQMYWFPA